MNCLYRLNALQPDIEAPATSDSADIHAVLKRHLPCGSSILELGSGLGPDLPELAARYRVTASDLCPIMTHHLRTRHAPTPSLQLDARTIHTLGQFNGIFSNKVMQHLNSKEMDRSMRRQRQVAQPEGIVAHTFWANNASGRAEIIRMVSNHFEILEMMQYGAFMQYDSMLIVARNDRPQTAL